jgi:hypothetical protein
VLTNNIQYAAVQNANMKYVVPSVDSAAAAAQNIDGDLKRWIVGIAQSAAQEAERKEGLRDVGLFGKEHAGRTI